MILMIKVILTVSSIIVLGYNLDTDYPKIYLDNKSDSSYFGYSVLLYYEAMANNSWLFVGAPRANYTHSNLHEPGLIYRCTILSVCEEIRPENVGNEYGFISKLDMKTVIKKENGWFGSAIAVEKNTNLLTICAPRTIISIFNPYTKQFLDTMQGMCYNGLISSNAVLLEDANVTNYGFNTPFWYNPLHGFSVHYPSIQNKIEKKLNRIIGEPKRELYGMVEILHAKELRSVDLSINDDLSQFGYSVTSGYYFKKGQLLYASGAPGWKYVGQVAIISQSQNFSIVTSIYGNDIGEFFGASLATCDLDNDDLDDLVIGAPHWSQDNGKVYIYQGSSKEQFEVATSLEGSVEGGEFGYSISCGDLDRDGFSDIIVGAPWEDSGVIYVYNGDINLKDKTKIEPSQRISASLFSLPIERDLHTFGFSLSEPIDIDANGYPDIAVGAYKSGSAIILRSKPVVRTNLTIFAIPNTLQRNTTEFTIIFCAEYHGSVLENSQSFKITAVIDEQYQRTKETSLQLISNTSFTESCVYNVITILENIRDFIEPISILAKHEFAYNNTKSFCKTCPVESRRNKLKTAQLLLPFDIGCGEDKVCNSNVSAVINFHGVQDNNTWVIGSNDISLEVTLQNHAEPAYLTVIAFQFPKGITLLSILPTCQEDTSTNDLVVTCDIGNPLGEGEQKFIKLDLDMRHLINNPGVDHELDFFIEIKSRSVNHGTEKITTTLNLKSEASLSLNGNSNEESYYFTTEDNEKFNITFQHTYQILKFGATPITNARLILKIPRASENSSTLLYMYKPQLYISGDPYECSSNNMTFLKTPNSELLPEVSANEYDLNVSIANQQLKRHVLTKSHVIKKRNADESHNTNYAEMIMLGAHMLFNKKVKNKHDSNDVIHLNCSENGITCSYIMCDLSALKTSQEIGKLSLKLIFDVTKLNNAIVKFTTEAHVEILQPAQVDFIPGTRSMMYVTTVFYSTPIMEKLQLWIILVSVSLGLVLLCIFVSVLNVLGFFKRTKKEELAALKTTETHVDGEHKTDESNEPKTEST